MSDPHFSPILVPLGDTSLLVRFGTRLDDGANRRAVAFARQLAAVPPSGVVEVSPSLVSVQLRYDPKVIGFEALCGDVRLRIGAVEGQPTPVRRERIAVRFDGEDLPEVAAALGMNAEAFVAAHNAVPLRVLATGFAPGFVYCGFHEAALTIARRTTVRSLVPAGTVLFAAGQTAIAATPIPTGWHVIGHTAFANFDAGAQPPVRLAAGDEISFEALS